MEGQVWWTKTHAPARKVLEFVADNIKGDREQERKSHADQASFQSGHSVLPFVLPPNAYVIEVKTVFCGLGLEKINQKRI